MKTYHTLIISIILFIGSNLVALAQTTDNKPVIKFTKNTHDFGDIYQGDVSTHTFTFTNIGNAPLILANVQTTCGCTAPEWTKDPILPGAEGSIKVVYNSSGKMGKQNKIITVYSNASNSEERLSIIVNVLPPVSDKPAPKIELAPGK
jgi:hypothetical protein